ncbi:NAD(P)/FAD-dependent oxidoreductase [Haloarchaeobius sp. HME9146]|uniref:NAD(P)/FAD-dependent oxidoreductase n=1 Tax=Haloarchaeobius sp. HME9146 TaxID=2978732 RepID=UPI0021BE0BAC|nr:NAD(P)/FAD-dependent oxidoreductase [Haloarchaeobius sp. HME9146]MCT9095935.1 NAD(P)/FAD-dependent oxidoreductase [Haloarchaeobius sp. HME9146]
MGEVADRWHLLVGAGVGLLPGFVLVAVLGPPGLLVGVGCGVLYCTGFRTTTGTPVDHGLTAAALSVPAWAIVQLVVGPLAAGAPVGWTLAGVAAGLPALPVWMLAGLAFGIAVVPASTRVRSAVETGSEEPVPESSVAATRIVVLGGGFAGLTAARELESRFGPDPTVQLTLVSETNTTLYTPLLAEVAAGSLDPSHVVTPLRTTLRRTRVVRGEATAVDTVAKRVFLGSPRTDTERVPDRGRVAPDGGLAGNVVAADIEGDAIDYDHLVLAVGSVAQTGLVSGVEEHAFGFKTLADAVALRNHVIDCFERADREPDPETQRALVTFVVAGAGFAGAELAGTLNDFVRGMAVYYPNVPADAIGVTVVHSHGHILPELPASLGEYALATMRERGVDFRLGQRVDEVAEGVVSLSTGDRIETETVVWTIGVRPNPLVQTLGVPLTEGKAVPTTATLQVPDHADLWAAGDCAAVTDPDSGQRYPATAQHAVRAARALARNLHAVVSGHEPTPFRYQSRGSLCVVGHQQACAELCLRGRSHRFVGLFAWVLWRTAYLAKLPDAERQLQVLVKWTTELVFPRDIAQVVAGEGRC